MAAEMGRCVQKPRAASCPLTPGERLGMGPPSGSLPEGTNPVTA